jgi:hypothetical protein
VKQSRKSTELKMLMRVHERGDEVHIELSGVAGRQQSVLLALSECRRDACGAAEPFDRSDVSVRAGANDMHIRLRGRDGFRFEAMTIYRCLRRALIERPADPPGAVAAS